MGENELSKINYENSFLTEVIARVDYLTPVVQLARKLPSRVGNKVAERFPIAEPQIAISQQLQISPEDVQLTQEPTGAKEWKFFGVDRSKFLSIRTDALIVKYTTYTNYETLRDEFLSAVNEFFEVFEGVQGRRLGLRYINNIRVDEGAGVFDWSDYIHENLLCAFNFPQSQEAISRVFNSIESNHGEFNSTFRYGMHNPDHPARIRKKIFVLDIDAYSQAPQSAADIARNLDIFHSEIQRVFEKSITDALRSLMNE